MGDFLEFATTDPRLRRVADVIEFDQIRRAQRLFQILLKRMGLPSFLVSEGEPRIDPARFDETLALCCDWIERRTGMRVESPTRAVIQRTMHRQLCLALARGPVPARP